MLRNTSKTVAADFLVIDLFLNNVYGFELIA